MNVDKPNLVDSHINRITIITFNVNFIVNFFKPLKESKSQPKTQPFPDLIEDVFHEPSAPPEYEN